MAMGCRRRRRAPAVRTAEEARDDARFTVTDAVTDAVHLPPCRLLGVRTCLPAALTKLDKAETLDLLVLPRRTTGAFCRSTTQPRRGYL